MDSSKLLVIGLLLNILGSLILIWRSAIIFLKSIFSSDYRKNMEDEAIDTQSARYAANTRTQQLEDPYVREFIATYKKSFYGLLLLIIGFIMQILSVVFSNN
jgi:hypothetical protein